MHEVVEQDPAIAEASLLVGIGDGEIDRMLIAAPQLLEDVGGNASRRDERVVGDVRRKRGLERRHPHEPQSRA